MPRPANFPALNELHNPGDTVVFRTHRSNVRKQASQYAKRKGFAVTVDLQDEPEDVRQDQGALYVAVRK